MSRARKLKSRYLPIQTGLPFRLVAHVELQPCSLQLQCYGETQVAGMKQVQV